MRRNDVVFPPPMVVYDAFPQQEQPSTTTTTTTTTTTSAAAALSPSIIITVLVLATAIILSASLFLLLRFLSLYFRRRNPSTIQILNLSPSSSSRNHSAAAAIPPHRSSIIDSLPLFTFSSLTSSSNCDCAVCLSKFEPQDQLRLLPVCCHAFHAECIDTWLANNSTCPLCRSAIHISDEEALSKILSAAAAAPRSGSFRVEIGSVSRRNHDHPGAESGRSTFSIGSSFDYIVDEDAVSEVTVPAARRSDDKSVESEINAAALVSEVGGGAERWRGSWLKEYVDRMASSFSLTSSSFRSSGRFFGGSSRRTEVSRVIDSELGDEIGEMFRWLSGV